MSNANQNSYAATWTAKADALRGVQVVELSQGVAGAYCGAVLAQLGASVTRCAATTLLIASETAQALMQEHLHCAKFEFAPNEVERFLARADIVVVETAADGHPLAARMRELARGGELRPDTMVVVLSANGIVQDAVAQGCGLTSSADSGLTFAIGSRGMEPLNLPYDIADYQTGINGATAALAGLLGRTGDGGPIDVSSRDVLANLVGTLAQNYVPFGRPWRREGTRPSMSGGVYPCGLFACKDGYVAVYCRGTAEWKGLLKAMGNPSWSQAERFDDPKVVATHHADEADSHMFPWLAQFTRAELMDLGIEFGFPAAPVRYVREALSDEQFAFRGSFARLARGDGEPRLLVPAAPWRYQSVPAAAGKTAPDWGDRKDKVTDPSRLLRGLRVLDFTWVWSGPMVTSILADLGAEVIKVEHPARPDSLRLRARPFRDGKPMEGPQGELNPWFNQLNHGKKSVIADLKSPQDRERLLELVQTCDVVVENMRPGALAASGLGYHDLTRRNPGIVMMSMSMAGQAGPLAQMKGYAGIMTSMAGLESITGYASPAADAPFTGMTMTALGDPNGAAHAIAALLAALYSRLATGQGTWIDLAQTDAILAIMGAPILEAQLQGHVPVRGNVHPNVFPHGHYRCAGEDRWLALAVANDAQWASLVGAIGPTLALFAALDLAGRQAQRAPIEAAISAWTCERSAQDSASLLRPLGIACAPVATYEEMLRSDWLTERGLTRTLEHPWIGTQDVFVPPWRFGDRSCGVNVAAPLLGQHTAELLGSDAAAAARHLSIVTAEKALSSQV